MICSNCGLYLSDPTTQSCPRCGQPVSNRPDRAPGSEQFPMGPDSPIGQQTQPGFSPPATSQWMKPSLAPAPAKPGRSRRRRNLLSLVVIIIIAACAGGYVIFLGHGRQSNNSSQTPNSGTNVLFSDPLTSNANGWASDAHCFFQDNTYHIKDNFLCYAPAGNFSDANITVQAKQVAGSLRYGYGIVFRRTSTGNWYKFDIDGNSQWAFFKSVKGTETAIVDFAPSPAINGGLNTVNTLKVQAKGSHFEFFVNGTDVGGADDTTFTSGLSGLAAGGPIEVAYTNFEITAAS